METFEQPPAPNSPPRAASPLEAAIYEYEQRAAKYHKDVLATNSQRHSPEKLKKLREKHRADLDALKLERHRIKALAQIQQGLEDYRKQCKTSSAKTLMKEDYHPTALLADNLRAVGEPKPAKSYEAHHIIPGKGQYRQTDLYFARLYMHVAGVGINDPRNGLWMPSNNCDRGHWGAPKCPSHKEIHRYNYETWIVHNFGLHEIPEMVLIQKLKTVKQEILSGMLPSEVLKPKNVQWDGAA